MKCLQSRKPLQSGLSLPKLCPVRAFLTLCLLTAVLASQRTAAQFFSPRSLLDSPFTPSNSASGLSSSLLAAFSEPFRENQDHLALGTQIAATLRTVQQGNPVGNLSSFGSFLHASWGASHKVGGQFYWERNTQSDLFVNEAFQRTAFTTAAETWSGRWAVRTGRATFYVGYGRESARTEGRSDLTAYFLPIFPITPDVVWQWSRNRIVLGALFSPASNIYLDIASGRSVAPSQLVFRGKDTRLLAPLDGAGGDWSVTLRAALDHATQMLGFFQQDEIAGRGQVRREDTLSLGEATTDYAQLSWGLALRRAFGSGAFSLLYSYAQMRLDTRAGNLNPLPLGYNPNRVDRVGYFLLAHLSRREYGARWEQRFARNHGLIFDYRWLEVPVQARYGYTAASFLIGSTDEGQWNAPDARGHLVRLRYTFPARPLILTLDASQIIPMPLGRAQRPTQPGPPRPRRESSGGWNLLLTVQYPF